MSALKILLADMSWSYTVSFDYFFYVMWGYIQENVWQFVFLKLYCEVILEMYRLILVPYLSIKYLDEICM